MEGSRLMVSPEDVVAMVVAHYRVGRCIVKVEVLQPPFDFFVYFCSSQDCSCIIHVFRILVGNNERLAMRRWHHGHGVHLWELVYLTKFTFSRFSQEAWKPDTVCQVITIDPICRLHAKLKCTAG